MNTPELEQLRSQVAALEQELADPAVVQQGQKLKALTQEHARTKKLLELIEAHERVTRELKESAALLEGDDEEMMALAQEDQARLSNDLATLEAELEELLLPRDPRDGRDVILEMRAGAGGEESAIFASELFRAYTRYGEEHGWTVHIVSQSASDQSGFKEVVAEVSGENVFGTLKYERGVHRVQRVPETEKQGRIHTSTVTVAVLPQAEEVDLVIDPNDLRIDTYRASGAGGQHVNKTDSAIRITHEPTGTVVAVQDERSQHKNKEKAMKILRARILDEQEAKQRSQAAADRKAQVGTGDRSEKIRTYNFPQDRITDHRIKESWSNIPAVMEGHMSPIFSALTQADRELKSAHAT